MKASTPAASTNWKKYAFYALSVLAVVGVGYYASTYTFSSTKTLADLENLTPEDIDRVKETKLDELKNAKAAEIFGADEAAQQAKVEEINSVVAQKIKNQKQSGKPAVPGNWYWLWTDGKKAVQKDPKVTAASLKIDLAEGQDIYAADFKLSEEQVQQYIRNRVETANLGLTTEQVTELDTEAKDEAFKQLQAGVDAESNGWVSKPTAYATAAGLAGAAVPAAGAYFGNQKLFVEPEAAAAKAAADAEADKQKKEEEAKKAAAAAAAQDDKKDPTTGEPIVAEGEGKDGEGENKTTDAESNNDGLGAWWILIVLAILALVGGAVYFFVFMPKEEDEEFDAEAQVEEEL